MQLYVVYILLAIAIAGLCKCFYNVGKDRGAEELFKQLTDDEESAFDQVETLPNCTVQILRNSITGEESWGWWENEEAEE